LGLIANLVLAGLKGIIGILANSSAMVADAGHSLSDLLSDFVTLWAIKMTKMPKDENHPYGHGKFETLGTLFVSVMLVLTGIGIAFYSFERLGNPLIPGILALWAAIISILAKEALYHITASIGKRAGSRVLVANAWHHRSDAISSVAALIGIGAAQSGFPILDPLAGILVSGLIVKTGIDIGLESIRDLTDETVEEDILQAMDKIVRQVDGVNDFHQVRARRMGPYILVDLHIEVNSRMSVSAAHQVAERVRRDVLDNIPTVNEILIHVDTELDVEDTNEKLMRPQHEIEADIHQVISSVSEIQGISHILCHYLNQKLTVQFEIIVDPNMRVHEVQQIALKASQLIEKIEDVDKADIHLELETYPI